MAVPPRRLRAVHTIAAFVLLAGCSAYLPAPKLNSGFTSDVFKQSRTGSWMLPEAKRSTLLYISTGSVVFVYTYPADELVGELSGVSSPEALCSDRSGHIFVPNISRHEVDEFAHGGTQPIATFTVAYSLDWAPISCSVDPRTNNLAVQTDGGQDVFIFKAESSNYTIYNNPYGYGYLGGTYDGSGNFFMRGLPNDIAELPKGSSTFINIKVPGGIIRPEGFAWDGSYLSVTNGDTGACTEYRLHVHGTHATIVSHALLNGARLVRQITIYKNRFIAPDQLASQVTFWKYPAFGRPIGAIDLNGPIGSAISVGR